MKKAWKILFVTVLTVVLLLCAAAATAETELGKSGWVKTDDGIYYGDENGIALTGQWYISGNYYIFDDTGKVKTGWVKPDDIWWRTSYSSAMSNSAMGTEWHYANAEGKIGDSLAGLSSVRIPKEVDSLTARTFAGVKRNFIIQCDPGSYAEKYALQTGLPYDNGKKKVIGTDITDADKKADWIIANYIRSGMSEKEKALVLHNWLIYNAHYDYTYSNYAANGVLVLGTGVCDSYSRAYGLLLTKVGIENKRLTGDAGGGHAWNLVRIGGQWYHVDCTWDDPNDSGDASVSGYEGTTFFLKGDAFMKQSRTFDEDVSADSNYVRWVEMGDVRYYYGKDGKRATGWTDLTEKESQYTDNGWTETDVVHRYYFDEKGVMQKGFQTIDGALYYLGDNGRMTVSAWIRKAKEDPAPSYYFGEDGKAVSGWMTIDGKECYFDAEHVRQLGLVTADGKTYYLTDMGRAKAQWMWNDNKLYYFDGDGVMATGMTTIDGEICCFGEDGAGVTGTAAIDGTEYFFENGRRAVGWHTVDGKTYYSGADGTLYGPGWMEYNGGWYYFRDNGEMATGWVADGGCWYYMDTDGRMATGWIEDDGKWFYFNGNGTMYTGWLQAGNNWYLLQSSGAMATGWACDGGVWYYMQQSGVMATGWIEDHGKWYYMSGSGALYTGWLQTGNRWYLMTSSGMATGWVKDGGNWYYFGTDGMMKTGWVEDSADGGSVWYYFDESGTMCTGRRLIGDRWEVFSESGAWLYSE